MGSALVAAWRSMHGPTANPQLGGPPVLACPSGAVLGSTLFSEPGLVSVLHLAAERGPVAAIHGSSTRPPAVMMVNDRAVGWYDDPMDCGRKRFWDGSSWLLSDERSGRLVRVGDRAWPAFSFMTTNQFGMATRGYECYARWFWSEVTVTDRATAAAAHLSMLPLIRALAIRRDQGRASQFIRRHATEAANFQITMLMATWIMLAIAVIILVTGSTAVHPWAIVPFCAFLLTSLVSSVWMRQAALRALKGGSWRYPICLRPLKQGVRQGECAGRMRPRFGFFFATPPYNRLTKASRRRRNHDPVDPVDPASRKDPSTDSSDTDQ